MLSSIPAHLGSRMLYLRIRIVGNLASRTSYVVVISSISGHAHLLNAWCHAACLDVFLVTCRSEGRHWESLHSLPGERLTENVSCRNPFIVDKSLPVAPLHLAVGHHAPGHTSQRSRECGGFRNKSRRTRVHRMTYINLLSASDMRWSHPARNIFMKNIWKTRSIRTRNLHSLSFSNSYQSTRHSPACNGLCQSI